MLITAPNIEEMQELTDLYRLTRADTTTCLHCWLREKLSEKDLDPWSFDDVIKAVDRLLNVGTGPPMALLRLLYRRHTYVETQNVEPIKRILGLNNEDQVIFQALNDRNFAWRKADHNKLRALEICRYHTE